MTRDRCDVELRLLGEGEAESLRGRVYIGGDDGEEERRAFVAALAGDGVLDAPAYDAWVEALQRVGWLPREPSYEPAPGGGRYARWRLTQEGQAAWTKMTATP